MIKFEDMKFKCHWDKERVCERNLCCTGCEYQPPDDEKPNGKAAPRPIEWALDYGGGVYPQCPACGEMPYSLYRCTFCGQRFIKDERAIEWEKPPEEVALNCFVCGGKGTMKGTRARSNGHFHGKCEKCGAVMVE